MKKLEEFRETLKQLDAISEEVDRLRWEMLKGLDCCDEIADPLESYRVAMDLRAKRVDLIELDRCVSNLRGRIYNGSGGTFEEIGELWEMLKKWQEGTKKEAEKIAKQVKASKKKKQGAP